MILSTEFVSFIAKSIRLDFKSDFPEDRSKFLAAHPKARIIKNPIAIASFFLIFYLKFDLISLYIFFLPNYNPK